MNYSCHLKSGLDFLDFVSNYDERFGGTVPSAEEYLMVDDEIDFPELMKENIL